MTSTRPPRSLLSWVGGHAPTQPVISRAHLRAVSPTHRNLVPAVRAFVMRFAERKRLAAVSPASARQTLACTTPSPAPIRSARGSAECIPGRPGSAAWLAVLLARPDEFLVEGVRRCRGVIAMPYYWLGIMALTLAATLGVWILLVLWSGGKSLGPPAGQLTTPGSHRRHFRGPAGWPAGHARPDGTYHAGTRPGRRRAGSRVGRHWPS